MPDLFFRDTSSEHNLPDTQLGINTSRRNSILRLGHDMNQSRRTSLGELHQELEQEQEAQVNRLLQIIRRQQLQLQSYENPTNHPDPSIPSDDPHKGSERTLDNLTRENQTLRARIEELERQIKAEKGLDSSKG